MEASAETESGEIVDLDRILDVLPHRPPFLFVERIVDVVPGQSAVGIKTISANEDFFKGHFPFKAIMPGVLIIEAMAQTAAALVMHTLDLTTDKRGDTVVYFMSVENGRFRRPVFPGNVLKLHVDKIQNRNQVWKFQGVGRVDGQIVAEARFTAMIAEA